MNLRTKLRTGFLLLVAAALAAVPIQEALALITGGEGNRAIRDPGWPTGAAAIFNVNGRIAWWEGPPLGGGQWHAECRGDAQAFNDVLADFAKLDVKSKRVVVRDGVGYSFWLATIREPAKKDKAKIDWTFMVWQAGSWEHLRQLPAAINPTDAKDADSGPPSQIDVYTGGNIRWADVKVPKGLKIVDQRLEAHGFTLADGAVLEGKVTDLATKKPVPAKVRLQRVEPKQNGYNYPNVAEATADADGRWVLKKTPDGWHRVLIEAEGYVPCVAGHIRLDGQPGWHSYDVGLARPATASGRVVDETGKPLPGVDVRIGDVVTEAGGGYDSARDSTIKTDKDGRFKADQLPVGRATIWVHKPGYCRPGLGEPITTPKMDIELRMMKAARVVVTVDFTGTQRPEAYIVQITPEGGDRIGTFGGTGHINDKNQIAFENVPPGRYVFQGRPNPSTEGQETDAVTVELKGGQTAEVKLNAK
jgi:hypothetical protein